MVPSDEFFDFCSGLHQDFERYGPEPEDWIDGALGFVEKGKLQALSDYIQGLLTGSYSNAQLQEIYRNTYTELRFGDDKELRLFLEMIRDRIEQKLLNK